MVIINSKASSKARKRNRKPRFLGDQLSRMYQNYAETIIMSEGC